MKKMIYPALILLSCACATAPKDSSGTRFQVTDSPAPADTVSGGFLADPTKTESSTGENLVSEEEATLYHLISAYRSENNLPVIPLSKSLTFVAQQHCLDLYTNKPDIAGPGCNAHSWSDQGKWTACCYTPDHKQSQCIWDKPKELTSYTGYGFEIACGSSEPQYADFVMSATYALDSWKASKLHNNVILNKENWDDQKWEAIGVGIYKGFACVWFGTETDPAGVIDTSK
ncbi:MAG: CAP domain-containing protein [Bacteroidetes bacterium]|nr:CAP domain-containing protein [Bacteroidota bacterium]